jgi:hypothetical protein
VYQFPGDDRKAKPAAKSTLNMGNQAILESRGIQAA